AGMKEIDDLEGTNGPDQFILGNGSTAFYNQSNWDDRAEISGFNDAEDQIQLHGSPSDYQLIQRNGDTRIFLTEGTKDMIGIISGYSEPVSLTDDIFSYVSGTDSGTDTPEEPVNQAPTATNDTDSTDEDTAININVLTNDSDPDGDSLNVSMVDGTNTKGQVSINNNGTISYDPNGQFDNLEADETATDSFSYTINDGKGGTDTATVNLTINGVSATTQPNDSSDNGTDNNNNNTGYNIISDFDPNTAFAGMKEIDDLEGTNGPDQFILGNGSTAFYNQSNWDDRAEISGFNDAEDQIQLHGSPSDYQLIQRNGDTRIFLTEGTKDMIGIISGYSEPVSLTDDIFSYVSGTDSGTDTPEEPVNQAPTATNDTDSTDEDTAININVLTNDSDPDVIVSRQYG
ncbi:Ig-like domain-containing protein, partial [Lyngbya sp. PCC 8106]|uniref:Ig-like domain-containing protein n=1 Tax=Lyngbya sp. (strain PCC 8106) TaxID=313612 RepID=UPI0000EAA5DD